MAWQHRSAGSTSEMLGRLQRRRAAAGGQAVARERKVSLMRKYRTGELPDVQQLSVAAFLAPLGMLLLLFLFISHTVNVSVSQSRRYSHYGQLAHLIKLQSFIRQSFDPSSSSCSLSPCCVVHVHP